MRTDRPLPGWFSLLVVGGTALAALWWESRHPLRAQTQGKLRRDGRNLAFAGLSAAAIAFLEKPLVDRLSRRARRGFVQRLGLPWWAETALAVVLMDYTLYVWHVLTHKSDFLYRFHRVHHADLDMDASTAVRFHAAEMALSVPWRAAQVMLIGTRPLALSIWQTLTTAAILFHHSNSRLPEAFERRLGFLVMTPRLHGIHHSIVKEETDSNWSTIFTWPDFLHRTMRDDIPQGRITVGLADRREGLTLGKLLAMPFRSRKACAPAMGREPVRVP